MLEEVRTFVNARFELQTFHDAEALLRHPEEAAQPRTLVVFVGRDLAMGSSASANLKDAASHISRAAAAAKFKGKSGSSLEILAAPGVPASRLILMGVGPAGGEETDGEGGEPVKPFEDFVALGGQTGGKLGAGARAVAIFDMPEGVAATPDAAAQFALGGGLRAYKFDHYKTKKKDADRDGPVEVVVATADPTAPSGQSGRSQSEKEQSVLWRRGRQRDLAILLKPRNSMAST